MLNRQRHESILIFSQAPPNFTAREETIRYPVPSNPQTRHRNRTTMPPQWLPRLNALLYRLRHLWAVGSFSLGLASYFLVERKPWLAAVLTAILVGTWLVLLTENFWLRRFRGTGMEPLAQGALKLMLQGVHQEAFFFSLPFVILQWSGGAEYFLFTGLVAWLPVTHQEYWQRVQGRVEDLGTIYTVRLGLVVPEFVPEREVNSIANIPDPVIAARFNNRIQGIDPGSALNDATRAALTAYGIKDMRLVAGNLAVMAASLRQAIDSRRWIVVTSLIPHWMFATDRLRFLDDPLGVFGGTERIHGLGHAGFSQRFPQIAAFLGRFEIPPEDFLGLMLAARQSSNQDAVRAYLAQHPERVRYWISGAIGECRETTCPQP